MLCNIFAGVPDVAALLDYSLIRAINYAPCAPTPFYFVLVVLGIWCVYINIKYENYKIQQCSATSVKINNVQQNTNYNIRTTLKKSPCEEFTNHNHKLIKKVQLCK